MMAQGSLRFAACCAALAAPGLARADVLHVGDAARRALASNAEMAVGRARIEKAEAELRAARLYLPSDPAVEATQGGDRAYADEGERVREIGLAQELPLPGKRGARRAAAEEDLEAARQELRALQARIVREVRVTFFELCGASKEAELARELFELNVALVEAAERRLQAGDISELEADLVKADAETARAEAASVERVRRTLAAELAGLIGAPSEAATVAVEGSVPEPSESLDPDALLRRALEGRPDLLASRARRAAAEARRTLARRAYLPDPELRLSLSRERGVVLGDDIRGDPAIVRGIESISDTDRILAFTVGVRIPISGQVQAAIALREAELAEADREAAALAAAVETEVRAAAGAATQGWESVRIFRALVPTAEKNLALLRTAYEAGQISLADYLVQKDRAIRVRRSLVQAEVELASALADLDRAVSRDVSFQTPTPTGDSPW